MKLIHIAGELDAIVCPLTGSTAYGIRTPSGIVEIEPGFEVCPGLVDFGIMHLDVKTTWSESQGERHFAFRSTGDRSLFCLLIDKVDGVGPAAALAFVKNADGDCIRETAISGDFKGLAKRCKGVGEKTAEKIVRTLAPLLGTTVKHKKPSPPDARVTDAKKALVAMGYKTTEADNALASIAPTTEDTAESLIKAALRKPRNP